LLGKVKSARRPAYLQRRKVIAARLIIATGLPGLAMDDPRPDRP
jgi:hypothetical protein